MILTADSTRVAIKGGYYKYLKGYRGWETITVCGLHSCQEVRILMNPSESQLREFALRDRVVRGLENTTNGDKIYWGEGDGPHYAMWEALGGPSDPWKKSYVEMVNGVPRSRTKPGHGKL